MSPSLLARRARVLQIRRTVAAVAAAVFIALFATIYIQMASGKDPALGTTTSAQVSATSTATTTPSTTSTPSSGSSAPAVTTSQS